MTSIGRVLYVERLTSRSTAAARKCLIITRKIMIPPPDSRDPLDGPPYFAKKTFPPDCWDPPATSSQARKCLTVGTHLVEAYVALSFCRERVHTYILVDVEACTCRSRGAHVACTRTYSGQGSRKKILSRMCTYGRGLERLLAHMYSEGSLTWLGR